MSFWRAFDDEDSAYSVVVEDDDRVAYAYIYDREAGGDSPPIVADVWLYNVAAPPDSWARPTRPDEAPLNPSPYVSEELAVRLEEAREVVARWHSSDDARLVDVLADGVVYARLSAGSKPGWSRFAAAESPVARPL